jgi:predicted transcriptional regulator
MATKKTGTEKTTKTKAASKKGTGNRKIRSSEEVQKNNVAILGAIEKAGGSMPTTKLNAAFSAEGLTKAQISSSVMQLRNSKLISAEGERRSTVYSITDAGKQYLADTSSIAQKAA